MVFPILNTGVLALAAFSSLLFFLVYRAALPRVIPGIPYNQESANRLLGDVPELLGHIKDSGGQVLAWWQQQAKKHNSSIIQLFLRPFARPFVVVSDFRETHDILLHRQKEFDRSDFFQDIFGGVLPYHHIGHATTDKVKAQKRLLAGTMMPAFLNEARTTANTVESQAVMLETVSELHLPNSMDKPVEFPRAPNPPAFGAVLTLTNSMEPLISSPFPALHHWFLRQKQSHKDAKIYKDGAIDTMIKEALVKFTDRGADALERQGNDRSVIDHMVRRELLEAAKEGRRPEYDTLEAKDQVFGFLMAGHETTGTTVSWGVKFLADNQQEQSRLRSVLRSTYPHATAQRRQPTDREIATLHHPYIDAVLEEILRCGQTVSAIARRATIDTEILGHAIPKGTDVFFLTHAGYVAPALGTVEEHTRSSSSQASKDKYGLWDLSDIGVFKPERWLRNVGESSDMHFDKTAGPNIQFGLGLRSCFGRRLAYVELRMLVVLIIWNFELHAVAKELGTYKSVDRIAHQPQKCYVCLKKAG